MLTGTLAPYSFTAVNVGGIIYATHMQQLRSALDPARSALGLSPVAYGEPIVAFTTTIKGAHVTELRVGVK